MKHLFKTNKLSLGSSFLIFTVMIFMLAGGIVFAQVSFEEMNLEGFEPEEEFYNSGPPDDFKGLISNINNILNPAIALVMTALVVAFLWSILSYLKALSIGDESAVKQYKSYIMWGLVAMFVAVSFWGIVKLVQTSFFDPSDINRLPEPNTDLPNLR